MGNWTLKHSSNRVICGGFCIFTAKTIVGLNCHFNGIRVYGRGKVSIGDNFHSGAGCEILTENHNFEGERIPYDTTYIIKDVHIGENVWIGNKVMILPGVSIGEGAIIQAGSVVVSNIPSCAIAGGHPARVFSYRDQPHYFELKEKKLFN